MWPATIRHSHSPTNQTFVVRLAPFCILLYRSRLGDFISRFPLSLLPRRSAFFITVTASSFESCPYPKRWNVHLSHSYATSFTIIRRPGLGTSPILFHPAYNCRTCLCVRRRPRRHFTFGSPFSLRRSQEDSGAEVTKMKHMNPFLVERSSSLWSQALHLPFPSRGRRPTRCVCYHITCCCPCPNKPPTSFRRCPRLGIWAGLNYVAPVPFISRPFLSHPTFWACTLGGNVRVSCLCAVTLLSVHKSRATFAKDYHTAQLSRFHSPWYFPLLETL